MPCWICTALHAARPVLLLCALIPAVHGCAGSAVRTSVPPVPATPGATVTDEYVCIPHAEAGELLLWIETVERLCR